MIESVTIVCGGILVLAVLAALYRMVKGPSILDRILSFDLVATGGVAFMAILSIRWETAYFLELILIFTMLGFFGTVAFVFYLERTFQVFPPDEDEEDPDRPEPHGTIHETGEVSND